MFVRARVTPGLMLTLLAAAAATLIAIYMTVGANGRWDFILPFRGAKVASMLLVSCCIATATVLFQTVSGNRILTPSIMGFDELYRLIQTSLVYLLGTRGVGLADPRLLFAAEAATMVLFALVLYRWLLTQNRQSLQLLLLVGIVIGAFFRSLALFLQRMVDPNEFLVIQDRLFANFNTVHSELFLSAALVVVVTLVVVWRLAPVFDVLLLGRDASISLGIDHRKTLTITLAAVAVLVSVSTALVGPLTFLGLLVANLAYLVIPSPRHVHMVPAAILIAAITLVGGQLVLERALLLEGALSIVIDLLGGITLVVLFARRSR